MDATSHVRVSDAGATSRLLPPVLTRFFGLVARSFPTTTAAPWRGQVAGDGGVCDGNHPRPAAT